MDHHGKSAHNEISHAVAIEQFEEISKVLAQLHHSNSVHRAVLADTGGMIAKLDDPIAFIGEGVATILVAGQLARSDLVQAKGESSSIGTTLVQLGGS